jgi:transposase InsO family protein
VSLKDALAWYGISRQAYHQAEQQAQWHAAEDQRILAMVREQRQKHPRMGVRKLHHKLTLDLVAAGITRGRDAFFALLGRHGLLVKPRLSRRRTTRSGLWRCPNCLAGMTLTRPHQAWVGDITYIATEGGFVYLALLTDAYSRFIVGWDASTSLAAEGCLRALNQAIAHTAVSLAGLVHHSDHGIQYGSWDYLDRLRANQILPSMGEVGNCYENALAERMNGILKCEYGLDDLFVNLEHVRLAVEQAVWLYNYDRPHLSLEFAYPATIHFT